MVRNIEFEVYTMYECGYFCADVYISSFDILIDMVLRCFRFRKIL